MQPFLTPTPKSFITFSDNHILPSSSHQVTEPSPRSATTLNSQDPHSRLSKRLSSKILPTHSKAFYKRSKYRAPLRRTRSKLFLSKRFSEIIQKFRSVSVRKTKLSLAADFDSPKSVQTSQQKTNLHLRPQILKKQQKPEQPEKDKKFFQKDPKFVLDTEKIVFHSAKQPFVVIGSKGKNKSIAKGFASELALALHEADLSSSGTLNYSKFCQVLTKLRFIKSPFNKTEEERTLLLNAWRLLGGYQESLIHVSDLQLFALIVMNLHFKADPPLFTSPQHKKKSIWALNPKDLTKLHQEFRCFYLNRTGPKESEVTFTSQDISEGSEECLNDPSMISEVKEHVDEMFKDFEGADNRIIRKVSLKELSSKSGTLTLQSTSDTPKNFSFRENSEEAASNDQVLTPKSVDGGSGISRVLVRKITVKLDESRSRLERSVVYKTQKTERFRFPENRLDVSEIKEDDMAQKGF